VFKVVRKIELEMANENDLYKEYSGEAGIVALQDLTQKLVFGRADPRICSVQSLSGTGALFLVASFIKMRVAPDAKVYVSKPTWPNHHGVFTMAGFDVVEYPYWDQAKRCLDFAGLIEGLRNAEEKSIIVLHACAHNPTGVDPTREQWEQIVTVLKERKHIAIIDIAYQGFASGDLERDAMSTRMMLESGVEFYVAQSFAKNMGLYGERIGMLHAVCTDKTQADVALSQLKRTTCHMYLNPPVNGGRIVQRVLADPSNRQEWQNELAEVAGRILSIRTKLRDGLVARKTPGTWDHIAQQIGMFSFTGLTPPQCDRMVDHWHIHMMKSGRISLAGLNENNVDYFIEGFDDCVRNA